MVQNYEEFIEEENKQYEKSKKENQVSMSKTKIPNMNPGQFKPPKMNIPKIQVPKF
ncbi:MAG TPA: hypothetical protein VMZ29_08585 [Candidatus Bathyarchaeia archaeon]|nr:hypothetical protein [Candidatus Bathyarchaeia archaeon]